MADFGQNLINNFFIALVPGVILFVTFFVFLRKKKSRGRYSPFVEDFLREPGETLRREHDQLSEDFSEKAAWLMVLIVLLYMSFVAWDSATARLVAAIMILPLMAYSVLKIFRIFDKSIAVRLGAEGERVTGQELSLLMRDGAWVFHDLPYQYGNIDHIVIAKGGIFAVETKAVSKPKSEHGNRAEWKVVYDGTSLQFPHRKDTGALEQARRHARYLHQHIKKRLGIHVAVTPVVAIPGWYIERTGKSDVWVINPKRGSNLKAAVGKLVVSEGDAERIASHIESVARSVRPGSKKLDPDSAEHYDFWNNPRFKPPAIG